MNTFTGPPERVRKPNPLFTMLSILSGIPTALFGMMYVAGSQSTIAGILFLWCAAWTYVWWLMRDR